jgi:hypothetical protein
MPLPTRTRLLAKSMAMGQLPTPHDSTLMFLCGMVQCQLRPTRMVLLSPSLVPQFQKAAGLAN